MILSIIVPVYNVDKYLRRCLDSLISQLGCDEELILIDDGSTDRCGDICDEYSIKNDSIVVIHKENGGLVSARNAGLEVAKGKIVTFVDSDDTVSEFYISKILELYSYYNSSFAFSYNHIVELNQKKENYFHYILDRNIDGYLSESILQLEKAASFNIVWNKIYIRSIIEKEPVLRFRNKSEPGEDTLFNCEYCTRIDKLFISNEILYNYYRQREREFTLSHKFYPDLYRKTLCFIYARNKMYSAVGLTDDSGQKELARQNSYYVFKCIPNMYRNNNWIKRSERLTTYSDMITNSDIHRWILLDENQEFLLRLFRILYKTKSPLVMDIFYSVAFALKNTVKSFSSLQQK